MAWSAAQLTAIETYGKNLLVAAAAGSGKTSVLVERIIRRLLDETQGFQIDELLVVTFTNAAAAEMRERVGAAIAKALKENPRSRHLERQMILLNAASISTLHAFCQNVVRQNFYLLDLDPKFRLANEQETDLLKRDALEELFESRYASGDEKFLDFVDHYGSERGDAELHEILLRLYEFSRSQPCPETWLASLADSFDVPDAEPIDTTVWADILKKNMRLVFTECAKRSRQLLRTAEDVGFEFYLPVFESDAVLFSSLLELTDGGWNELYRAVSTAKFQTLRAPKGTDEEQKEFFSQQRSRLKEKLKQVKENYFIADGEALKEDLRAVRPMMNTVAQLTISFAAAFAAAKQERAIVDFSDLEHFCLKILRENESVAKALQEKYREVMVDEYQDTNGVQEAILSLVRRPHQANLFLVGDVKQSIYRFRLAEPELFMDKYHTYPLRGDAFARVDLAQNFRSRSNVVGTVNFIFEQVMSPEAAELSYGDAEQLHPGLPYPKSEHITADGPTELYLLDKDDSAKEEAEEETERSGFAAEAQFIAARIRRLMDDAPAVFDKEKKQYRALAWRDIVILLRSVKNKADVLLETLQNADIPVYANVDGGYFQATEIQVMLALLQMIDNPRQDIPLASVLFSPLVGMDAKTLAHIRLLKADGSLYDALLLATAVDVALSEKEKALAADFVVHLQRWRSLARRQSVPELIWQLFRDTGYYDYVGGMPGGVLRQANLRMLYDRARQYEKTNFRGLFRFLRFIEKMRNTGTDLSVARALGENEDVVRIMSIHRSKGLEFPIVIVADLGKNFNRQDSKAVMLLHKKLGIGPYVTQSTPRVRYPTIARQALAAQINHENIAEELRVLYVALTRAREKLILIGSVAHLQNRAADWCQHVPDSSVLLPDYVIAGAGSYLDWICPAVSRHKDGAPLRSCASCIDLPHPLAQSEQSSWLVKIISPGKIHQGAAQAAGEAEFLREIKEGRALPESAAKEWVATVLNWQYPNEQAVHVPAKLSVTEMKRRFVALDETAEQFFRPSLIAARPRFMQEKGKMTGSEYGTLMHSVMQHIDLAGDLSAAGLEDQLRALVEREALLPEQAPLVNRGSIRRFFASSLGRRLLASAKVRRELPFSIMLDAKRFYPDLSGSEEQIFVQGIIDVLFDEPDGMILVDYKTDGGRDFAAIADRYQLQLTLYAEAIAKIFGRPVKEKYLYLFASGKLLPITRP